MFRSWEVGVSSSTRSAWAGPRTSTSRRRSALRRAAASRMTWMDTAGVHERELAQVKHDPYGLLLRDAQGLVQDRGGRDVQFAGDAHPGHVKTTVSQRATKLRQHRDPRGWPTARGTASCGAS